MYVCIYIFSRAVQLHACMNACTQACVHVCACVCMHASRRPRGVFTSLEPVLSAYTNIPIPLIQYNGTRYGGTTSLEPVLPPVAAPAAASMPPNVFPAPASTDSATETFAMSWARYECKGAGAS